MAVSENYSSSGMLKILIKAQTVSILSMFKPTDHARGPAEGSSALWWSWVAHRHYYFRLLLWNRWIEFNKTWQKTRSQRSLSNLFFKADRKKMVARTSDWLRQFLPPLKPLNGIQLDMKQDLNVLYQVCVFQPKQNLRWPPWPLIGWDIFDFSETA